MDVFEGAVLFDEPGVKAVEFRQRSHALAHFLRASPGGGALLSILARRAPEVRHLRRWLGSVIQELGCLFLPTEADPSFRYIEVGLES
jgi:hypothetical protein